MPERKINVCIHNPTANKLRESGCFTQEQIAFILLVMLNADSRYEPIEKSDTTLGIIVFYQFFREKNIDQISIRSL